MAGVVGGLAILLNLESIGGGIGKVLGNSPSEGSASGSADGGNSLKVGGGTLAKDEGGWGLILGRVGDSVGLSSYDTAGGVIVDLDGEGSGDEGSARNKDLEETHVDDSVEMIGD